MLRERDFIARSTVEQLLWLLVCPRCVEKHRWNRSGNEELVIIAVLPTRVPITLRMHLVLDFAAGARDAAPDSAVNVTPQTPYILRPSSPPKSDGRSEQSPPAPNQHPSLAPSCTVPLGPEAAHTSKSLGGPVTGGLGAARARPSVPKRLEAAAQWRVARDAVMGAGGPRRNELGSCHAQYGGTAVGGDWR